MFHIVQVASDGKIFKDFRAAVDDAYNCKKSAFSPFRRPLSTKCKDSFKFYESWHRAQVEETFGQTNNKFRVLKREMFFELG